MYFYAMYNQIWKFILNVCKISVFKIFTFTFTYTDTGTEPCFKWYVFEAKHNFTITHDELIYPCVLLIFENKENEPKIVLHPPGPVKHSTAYRINGYWYARSSPTKPSGQILLLVWWGSKLLLSILWILTPSLTTTMIKFFVWVVKIPKPLDIISIEVLDSNSDPFGRRLQYILAPGYSHLGD